MNNQNITDKISIPYAEALLELSQKSNQVSQSVADLSLISSCLLHSKDLQETLFNPLINSVIKKNIVKRLFEEKVNNFVLTFLLVLIDRRRIFFIFKIINKYVELTYRLQSIVVVELYTAFAFNETQQNQFIEKIKILTKSQNIKLVTAIDSTLMGGFIIKIGSKIIDASLSGKLYKMSLHLNTSY